MKTIEEKARAYDEVRKKIAIRFGSNVADEFFAEFEESEDEKVRKELIKHLKELSDWKEDEVIPVKNPSYYQQWASWLEKQGQVKESTISQHEIETCKENGNSLTYEDEKIRKEIINYFQCQSEEEPTRKEIHDKWIAWLENIPYTIDHEKREGFHLGYKACLEKQNEQKSTDSYCQENCKGYQETGKCFADGECKAKREAEQKTEENKGNIGGISPNWSEEDMSKVQRICKYLNEAKKYYADITEVRECIEWLKSLQDRVQPKQEWNEEDEDYLFLLNSICKDAEEKYRNSPDVLVRKEIANARNWLKSLKERIGG